MEYYVLKDYTEKQPKKLNIKKLIKTIIVIILISTAILLFAMYIGSADFRRMDR